MEMKHGLQRDTCGSSARVAHCSFSPHTFQPIAVVGSHTLKRLTSITEHVQSINRWSDITNNRRSNARRAAERSRCKTPLDIWSILLWKHHVLLGYMIVMGYDRCGRVRRHLKDRSGWNDCIINVYIELKHNNLLWLMSALQIWGKKKGREKVGLQSFKDKTRVDI